VARGYLKRPELTAEKFVPHPFSVAGGELLYRTGDWVRYRSDGSLEFLGRWDEQVKIRGYRIELGEIEARLMEHAGVQQAVVVAREDISGEKRLIAYYTVAATVDEEHQGESSTGVEQLRAHLAAKLPDYMMPAAYVRMEKLPLTANGKLDRKTLPLPERSVNAERGYEPPLGEIETKLAAIWTEVLKLDRVGRHDNFFELGGHSLLAMRIVVRTRAIFRVAIQVRMLFEKPTIRAFGEALRELAFSNQAPQDGQIPRLPREGELLLSFNQESRLLVEWWAEMRGAPYAPFHLVMSFSVGPEINAAALEQALNALASRHEILRTSFSDPKRMPFSRLPQDIMTPLARIKAGERVTAQEMHELVRRLLFGKSIFKQSILPEITLSVAQIDLEGLSAESEESELSRIAAEAIETPFDYESAPLIRVLLFRKNSAQQSLLIVLPHLLGDVWSMEIFSRELWLLYEAFMTGASWRLPELRIQSVDFAAWQRSRLQGAYLDEMTSYWAQRWSEFSLMNIQELPFAKPSPEAPGFMVETSCQTLDRALSTGLRSLLHQRNITLHMLGLAALKILLHLYTGKERIGVWGLFANRTQPETENLMGWLANGHIMGVSIYPHQDIDSLLAHVREVVLDAHSHQEVPMALLWQHFMKDLQSNPGGVRSPIQPHISFDTETHTQRKALVEEPKSLYRIGRLALKVVVIDNRQDIQILIQYSADRFSSESIAQMMGDWGQIVQTIVDASATKISEFATVLQPRDFRLI
jgi:hypothetical protein